MLTMERFYSAHRQDFELALAEIRRGYKQSHWMWYIFPQLKGLGRSSTAQYYGLDGLEEARRFAADPVLAGICAPSPRLCWTSPGAMPTPFSAAPMP